MHYLKAYFSAELVIQEEFAGSSVTPPTE